MRSNRGQNIRALCLLGLLTAVCFAGNYARIILPVSFGGYSAFTLGNITGVLSGLLMGPVGGVASGLGAALYDMTNPAYIMEAPLTFLNKGLMGVAAGLAACGLRGGARSWLEGRHPYPRLLLAAAAGCAAYYVVYFVKVYDYNCLLIQGLPQAQAWIGMLDKIPASVFNGTVAIVLAPPLALAIGAALRRSGFRLA